MKCRDCKLKTEDFITGYSGAGIYKVSVCSKDITAKVVVDAEAERECQGEPAEEVMLARKER